MDSSSDNIIIHVYGDYHQTYPNEPHLSVSYEYRPIWLLLYPTPIIIDKEESEESEESEEAWEIQIQIQILIRYKYM